MRKKAIITAIIVLVVAVFSAGFVRPGPYNRALDRIDESLPFDINRRVREVDFELGLDLQGGVHLQYEADLEDVPERERSDRMAALRDLIEQRVDHFGIGEPLVQVRGERLIVELPGVEDQQEAIEEIGETPFLEFRLRRDDEDKIERIESKRIEVRQHLGDWFYNDYDRNFEKVLIEDLPEKDEERLNEEVEDWELAFESLFVPTEPELTGRYLRDASMANIDMATNTADVTLEFDSEGAEILRDITAQNVGEPLPSYLDGRQLHNASIREEIPGGSAVIHGLEIDRARELAQDLQIGALPVPIELISERSIGPELADKSLEVSVRAGMIGFAMVIVFMLLYYKLLGVFASLSLTIYAIFVLTAFKVLGVTLTLSGIAGFVLSIGMAIDANILIFSRVREELNRDKPFEEALREGFSRAWPSIRDGNLTTLLVAFILFLVSTSFVQGFAIVLIVGILVSLFAAMVITRSFLYSFIHSKAAEIKRLWV